jgi:hypothetical protein
MTTTRLVGRRKSQPLSGEKEELSRLRTRGTPKCRTIDYPVRIHEPSATRVAPDNPRPKK